MPTFKLNGYELDYSEAGEGETLVLVHGSLSDHRIWQNQLEDFGKSFHTIAYSRRFHWPNEKIAPEQDYSMEQHVSDLEQILQQLDTPVHLVGHSYGGFICLLLAMRSPGLIQSMVLAEPPVITIFVSNTPKPGELLKLLFSRPQLALTLVKFGATAMEPTKKEMEKGRADKAIDIFGKATLGADNYAKMLREHSDKLWSNVIVQEFTGSGFPPLRRKEIRKVEIPTLLIEGENSPALFKQLLHELENLLSNGKRVRIPHASHISHQDNPAHYNREVLDFLNDELR